MNRTKTGVGSSLSWIRLLPWFVLILGFALAVLPLIPPSPVSSRASEVFPVGEALDHVEVIGRAPHPIGSEENERVRSYLIATLAEIGLSPQTQAVEVMDYFGTPGDTVEVVNVMARIEGSGGGDAVAFVAHYDTVPSTPGANDNSTSVGILLTVGAELVDAPVSSNDVILLFTDGEEPSPRFGATAFADNHPWFEDIEYVVNLEASGGSGPSILAQVSGPSGWSVEPMVASVDHPVAFSLLTEIADLLGGFGTDFDAFEQAGIPGLMFAYLHGSPIYHTPDDSLDNVSRRSVAHQGDTTLALAKQLGDTDLSTAVAAGDRVFLSVAWGHMIRYSAGWAWSTGLAAALVFALAVLRHGMSVRRILVKLGVVALMTLVCLVAGSLIWVGIAALRPTPAVWESYLYLALLLLLTLGIWRLLVRRRNDRLDVGVVALWVVFAVATSSLAPGTSYLFVWPALLVSILLLFDRHRSLLALLLVSLVTLVASVPLLDIIFQMAQPRPGNPDSQLIPVAGVVTALAFMVVGLIEATWPRSSAAPA